jgi:hypothetical protein
MESNEILDLEGEVFRLDAAIRIASCTAESSRLEACDAAKLTLHDSVAVVWFHFAMLATGAAVAGCLFLCVWSWLSKWWTLRRVARHYEHLLWNDDGYRFAAAAGRRPRKMRRAMATAKIACASTVVLAYVCFVINSSALYSAAEAHPGLPWLLRAALRLPAVALGSSGAAATVATQYLVFSCGLPVLSFAFFLCSSACADLQLPQTANAHLLKIARQILHEPQAALSLPLALAGSLTAAAGP